MYNIDYRNCVGLDISYNGVNHAIKINQGFYGVTDFQNALLNALNTIDASLNITAINYDTMASKLNIAMGVNSISTIEFKINGLGTLYKAMGLASDQLYTLNVGSKNILTMPYCIDLFGNRLLLLQLNNIPCDVYCTNTVSAFARIQINTPYNSTIFSNNISLNGNKVFLNNVQQLDNLNISLTYYDGNNVELNGLDWTCSIGIEYKG